MKQRETEVDRLIAFSVKGVDKNRKDTQEDMGVARMHCIYVCECTCLIVYMTFYVIVFFVFFISS